MHRRTPSSPQMHGDSTERKLLSGATSGSASPTSTPRGLRMAQQRPSVIDVSDIFAPDVEAAQPSGHTPLKDSCLGRIVRAVSIDASAPEAVVSLSLGPSPARSPHSPVAPLFPSDDSSPRGKDSSFSPLCVANWHPAEANTAALPVDNHSEDAESCSDDGGLNDRSQMNTPPPNEVVGTSKFIHQ